MDYLAKAVVAFYAEHGIDPARVSRYNEKLSCPKTTLLQFRNLSREHMPKTTNVLNIEYETKRKFYYNSDNFINGFKLTEERGSIKKPMERIYKILDYREIFLDYLTSKTLAFHKGEKENGELKFLPWWERLRNTKHDGKKVSGKLLREYSCAMDKNAVQKRMMNSLASIAVYENCIDTGFVADLSDVLADITDNQAHRMMILGEGGEILDEFNSKMIAEYGLTKAKKEIVLKNRKKKLAEKKAQAAAPEELSDEPPAPMRSEKSPATVDDGRIIRCVHCHEEKPSSEFWTYGGQGNEDSGQCIDCAKLITAIIE